MIPRAFLAITLFVYLLLLMACGGGSTSAPEAKKEEPKTAAPAAPPVDAATAATIEGSVKFTGKKPVMKPVSMDATPACARQHDKPVLSEEVVVNDNGTLRNVFVYVKSGLPDQKWPVPKMVTVDQVGCVYKPHVLGVMVDQDIQFLNDDPTNHNIHPLPRVNREWNESQPPKGDPKVKQFPKPELMMPVKCNVHPWMRIYISVVPHPFFAVTGEDGSFSIKGLPAGDYTLEALHERFGAKEIKIKVAPKESGKAEFSYAG